jgi:hypothetical protein
MIEVGFGALVLVIAGAGALGMAIPASIKYYKESFGE